MSEAAKWYVVHTYSGYEHKVASNLMTVAENRKMQNLIHEIRIPTETVVELKDNKKVEVERLLFPGYVFVKMEMTSESWYIVRNTRGCTGFVGPESKQPVPLSDKEVAELGIETKSYNISYGPGDVVNIIDGPFEGYVGTVVSIDMEKETVQIMISMFGRETPTELELSQIEVME
ncbi:MAG: transcription termination/antitermination factor NusG [Clostridia bacterium]|nr:transcription termination/antitermination factor NusG [Clostridia bacterium]